MNSDRQAILVCLGAGIGNVVLATPLLVALDELGFVTDLLLAADYPQTATLLQPWASVRYIFDRKELVPVTTPYAQIVPALPPFYYPRYAAYLSKFAPLVARPSDRLFYLDEQSFYLSFARALGYPAGSQLLCTLPISPAGSPIVTHSTLVIAPGCKTGIMAAKRWPHFNELAEAFDDVVIVGTNDDLHRGDGTPLLFPAHCKSLVNQLTLRQTAEVMAGAGVVVANDSGLAHVAAALGVPTIILFGPTPDRTLGQFPPNVTVLRQGLPCEPCWFQTRFRACAGRITCLQGLKVETVIKEIERQGLKRRTPPPESQPTSKDKPLCSNNSIHSLVSQS